MKKKMGRPKKKIDWALLDDLLGIQATLAECSQVLKVSDDTLELRVKENYGITFSELFKSKRVIGHTALRRTLFEMSRKHPQVAIFLSKQWLGYRDKQDIEISTPPPDVTMLPDGELLDMVAPGLSKAQRYHYLNVMSPTEQETFLASRQEAEGPETEGPEIAPEEGGVM